MKPRLGITLAFFCSLMLSKYSFSEPIAANEASENNYLVWKVVSPHGSATVVGAVHFGQPGMLPFPKHVDDEFQRASSLVVESDEGLPESFAALHRLHALAGNKPLCQYLSDSNCGRLNDKVRSLGLNPEAVGQFRPWIASMTLTGKEFKKAFPEEGVDEHFIRRAKEMKLTVHPLETLYMQFSMLDAMSEAEQAQNLESALEPLDIEENERRFAAWKRGDIGALLAIEDHEDKREGPLVVAAYNRMLRVRNETLGKGIDEWIRKPEGTKSFVVVGYMHLIGPNNMLDQLAARGYRVSRVLQPRNSVRVSPTK